MRSRRSLGILAVILGLASLVLPLVAFGVLQEPLGVPFDHPAKVSYYRQIVLAFTLGVVLGIAALIIGRKSTVQLLKLTSIGLGAGGGIVSLFLLLIVVMICGPTVLWGSCNP